MRLRYSRLLAAVILASFVGVVFYQTENIFAQKDNTGEFAIQVTPSPIIETVAPGSNKKIELNIRNATTKTENLKLELREFSFNSQTGEVNLSDKVPALVTDWFKVENPTIQIDAGKTYIEKLNLAPPKDVGYSYYFAVVISRANEPANESAQTRIKASVAVFTLINIDRPDAKRKFEVQEFSTKKRVYDFLPVDFTVKFKNTGNLILKPYGNIYIQRTGNSNNPITVLKLNSSESYILPDTTRGVTETWKDGFPVYESQKTAENQDAVRKLTTDFSKVQKFRFGKYVAKLVAVYNDGERDIPVETSVEFWVIPWKIIIVPILILLIVVVGLFTIFKKSITGVKRKIGKNSKKNTDDTPEK